MVSEYIILEVQSFIIIQTGLMPFHGVIQTQVPHCMASSLNTGQAWAASGDISSPTNRMELLASCSLVLFIFFTILFYFFISFSTSIQYIG